MPKVSIMVLTKNRSNLLENALDSILQQSFKDYEIVLINDGSTDATQDVIGKYKAAGHPIINIYHENSVGIAESRMEALQNSRGEFIAILDDDDVWKDSEKLVRQVQYLEVNPKTVLIGTATNVGARPVSNAAIRRTMLLRNNFFTSTVMFRRAIALAAGGFIKDAADVAEDYDLWLRLGEKGEMNNESKITTLYTESTRSSADKKKFFRKQLRLIQQHRRYYPHYLVAALLLRMRLW